jgi:hypothetical protein
VQELTRSKKNLSDSTQGQQFPRVFALIGSGCMGLLNNYLSTSRLMHYPAPVARVQPKSIMTNPLVPIRCIIDGQQHFSPYIYVRETTQFVYLTQDEFDRIPLHKAQVIGRPEFISKRLRFPPTFLSDRFPQVTSVSLLRRLINERTLVQQAMPYINRGLPVPAPGARWMALPLRSTKK